MRQIIQNLQNGQTLLEEIPVPLVKKGQVLIQTKRSLVSLGTEKMLVEFGKGSLLTKARQQPEKVKEVLTKINQEGLLPTLEAVFNKLGEPLPLGYCNAGVVVAVGEGVTEFKIGDRVASNGPHAEYVCVPKNLTVKIPDNVTDEEAAFTVISSIGLQGIRLAEPSMGETVAVIGLGLIGLITAQLLVSNGCKVIGFDVDEQKVKLAKNRGVNAFNVSSTDPVKCVEQLTNGIGSDAVIITASSKSNEIIKQAANMSRKRGRIILVGVIGLDINRVDFYKKELTFQVSCSYGPGRYDDQYELKGIDYPLEYVRWTEKRNFETILEAISSNKLHVKDLITERKSLNDYLDIYSSLGGNSIASILEYPETSVTLNNTIELKHNVVKSQSRQSKGVVGVIGAGNFTKMTMLPVLKNTKAHLKYISSATGLTAKSLANKYKFEYVTTDYHEILKDDEVDLVMITTRHDIHAKMVVDVLNSGKHVFVEKPLAINQNQLNEVIESYKACPNSVSLNVGYNRRFSPLVKAMKSSLGKEPTAMNIIATMNAGFIPRDIWIHDLNVGGGRIIGEACHFMDLMVHLTGSHITEVNMSSLGQHVDEATDNAIITLKFKNGSQGVINYFSNGSKSYQKERVEVFHEGRVLILNNFSRLEGHGFKNKVDKKCSMDKGHRNQFQELIDSVKTNGEPLIPLSELVNVSIASFAAIESLKSHSWISVPQVIS
jgi:predicted dehydrogenase/threonine dehydrogenase-like Zn-dependent dehydrogenase